MSRRRILDTNRLIFHWRSRRVGSIEQYDRNHAIGWAKELADLTGTSAILTPVRIEFLCGVSTSREYELSIAFLERFKIVDEGIITAEDWQNCQRYAPRVPHDGTHRDFGDCLIEAISRRLKLEILTSDLDLGRRARSNDPGFVT